MNHNGSDNDHQNEVVERLLQDLQALDRVVPERKGPSIQSWEMTVRDKWRILAGMRRRELLLFCFVALLMITGNLVVALLIPTIFIILQVVFSVAAIVVVMAIRTHSAGRRG